MASLFIVILGSVISTYVFLRLLLKYTQDSREPPAVEASIPFISPILGMISRKTHFYTHNRDKYKMPIYTLRMPGTRMYVVNSTALIPVVQRQFMTLAFPPIEVRAVVNAMGASKTAEAILMKDVDAKDGNWNRAYPVSFSKAIHPAMSPGPSLDAMNWAAIQSLAQVLETLAAKAPRVVDLFGWVRHEVSLATSDAVYGPMNPFRDTAIETAFWKFGPGIVILMLGVLPSILAKQSIEAREVIFKAFQRYFREEGHKQGSGLIKARYDHSISYDISMDDIARFEIGGAIAILGNTGPAASWLIYRIFSDPLVLEDVRREISQLVVDGPSGRTLDISNVKFDCPILFSTFQETLRFHSIGTSVRVVMEDHLLDGKHLLKKGGTVMIPAQVQHSFASAWGDNVAEFDHRRFVKPSSTAKGYNPVAFRGFGGGTTLCPGRHFASTEAIGLAALMVLRFDVAPVSGKWVCPTTENAEMWTTMPHPDFDVEVEITPRKDGNADKKLNVVLSRSDKAMGISVEDMIGK